MMVRTKKGKDCVSTTKRKEKKVDHLKPDIWQEDKVDMLSARCECGMKTQAVGQGDEDGDRLSKTYEREKGEHRIEHHNNNNNNSEHDVTP